MSLLENFVRPGEVGRADAGVDESDDAVYGEVGV